MSNTDVRERPATVQCTNLADLTQQDMDVLARAFPAYGDGLVDRIVNHLKGLKNGRGGFQIDRLEHSVQTATRALRDGRDEEYVIACLLHDIGDELAPHNHPEVAAAILKPFVREDIHWMIQNHDIFQGYYFFQFMGKNRDEREKFRGHPHFQMTVEFCDLYDSPAFDPAYKSEPLEFFVPMLRRVFSTPKGPFARPPI